MGLTKITSTVTANSVISSNNFKNKIINGDMVIDQRFFGTSFSPSDSATMIDGFRFRGSQTLRFTSQQNAGSITPPIGFTNYLGLTSSSAYTSLATDYFGIVQRLEGINLTTWLMGTSNAATVTLSFWVRSSITGLHSGSIKNAAENRSYIFTFNIIAANTWEFKNITLTLDTLGTWKNQVSTTGLILTFNLGSGSNFLSFPNSWINGNFYGATSSVNLAATNGATFYVTGIQLENSPSVTPFEYREYTSELLRCQRFLYSLNSGVFSTKIIGFGYAVSTTLILINIYLPVRMVNTLIGISMAANLYSFWDGTTTLTGTGYGSQSAFTNSEDFAIIPITVSGATANRSYYARFNATNSILTLESSLSDS